NSEPGLQDDFTAALIAGNDGTTEVGSFEEYILTGSTTADNRLQFLGGAGSRNVRFVASGADTALSLDLASEPPSAERAEVIIGKGTVANGSFRIEAKNTGTVWNETTIDIVDSGSAADNYVLYDKETNQLTIAVEIGTNTAQDAVDLINGDSYVSSLFGADVVDGDGTGVLGVALETNEPGFSGAQLDPGALIVNLA